MTVDSRWHTKHLVALGLLFALFLGIRLYHLDRQPVHNICADEYAWTWSGMTLLLDGTPRAWSWLGAYRRHRQYIEWRGNPYRLVKPWMDHPPLYSLYAGGWMLLLGHRDILQVDLWQMRAGVLPLAALSFGLLALVLRELIGPLEVLLALLFYAVLPPIVLHHRLVVSENLCVPIILGATLAILRQRRNFANWRVGLVIALSAALPLTKVSALSATVFLVMFALILGGDQIAARLEARWIMAGAVALGTGLGLAAYVAYGERMAGNLFFRVLASQHERFRGFAGMAVLLFEPKEAREEVKDLLSMLASALALGTLALPRVAPWGLATLTYAACMAFFVDEVDVHGWYFIPLYPWLCAALAVSVVHASRRRVLGLSLLWCSAAWLTIASVAYSHQLLPPEGVRYLYLLVLLLLYGCWSAWPRFARMSIPVVNAVLIAGAAVACLVDVYLRP